MLLEELLKPMGITQKRLAEHMGVSVQRVNEIVRGKRGVTAQTAWLLSETFGTTPSFWMSLQSGYDLSQNLTNAAHTVFAGISHLGCVDISHLSPVIPSEAGI